jgi:hypothetical protein
MPARNFNAAKLIVNAELEGRQDDRSSNPFVLKSMTKKKLPPAKPGEPEFL